MEITLATSIATVILIGMALSILLAVARKS
jgi:hypothetical protein